MAVNTGRAGPERFGADYFAHIYRDYAAQNPPGKLAFYRRLAERAAAGSSRPRLLEIGCGPGLFLEALDPVWQRFGTDVSQWAVAEARRRAPTASIEQAPAERIPFDGEFDVIAAFDVLEHLDRPELAIAEATQRLRPGGALLFVAPVYDGPAGLLVRLLDRDPTHVQKRSRRFWLDLASRRLEVEEWYGVFRYLMPWGWYWHRPTRALRRIAPAVAVVCRRRA